MISIVKTYVYNNYFFLSKYNLNSSLYYPKILTLEYKTLIYLKKKNKLFLLLNIVYLLFFNSKIKTHFIYKNSNINIVFTKIKSQNQMYVFLYNFIYIYLPFIDSFLTQWKTILNKQIISLSFFKFPLILELNVIFLEIDYLTTFMKNYKFQINLILTTQKNTAKIFNLLYQLKLPLIE